MSFVPPREMFKGFLLLHQRATQPLSTCWYSAGAARHCGPGTNKKIKYRSDTMTGQQRAPQQKKKAGAPQRLQITQDKCTQGASGEESSGKKDFFFFFFDTPPPLPCTLGIHIFLHARTHTHTSHRHHSRALNWILEMTPGGVGISYFLFPSFPSLYSSLQ